jgi:hypothetical protein
MALRLPYLLCLLAIASLSSQQQQFPLFVGNGYNIIKGNPLVKRLDDGFGQQIFQFNSPPITTADGKYIIPSEISHLLSSSCSLASEVDTYRGSDSYAKELSSKVTLGAGYKGRRNQLSFTASAEWKSMANKTMNSSTTVSQATAECHSYEISMDIFTYPPISSNFSTNVINCYKSNDWSSLLDRYGTHFVYQTTMGGRITYEVSILNTDVA